MKKDTRTFWLILWIVTAIVWLPSISAAQEKVHPKLNPRELTASLVGHAHIDLSWLWLWEETVYQVAPETF